MVLILVAAISAFASGAAMLWRLRTGEAYTRLQALPADVVFTASLLALSRVGSLTRDDFPEPAPVGSSSLVLIRPLQ